MIKVIYWIENEYNEETGWTDAAQKESYLKEVAELFGRVGWKMERPESGWPSAVLARGEEKLEVHPLYITGKVRVDSPKGISKLLLCAKTFHFSQVETVNISEDLTDVEYLIHLRGEQEQMERDILSLCSRSKGDRQVSSAWIYEWIARKYHIRRKGENGEDVILLGVFRNLIEKLVYRGNLEESRDDRKGLCYRIVRDIEKDTSKAA
ncbi:MAG: hypothetical protein LUG93_02945 [Lachnospiraceae bacterium]|nr:hypothetical protein [Lachnospiraceae bacterium]